MPQGQYIRCVQFKMSIYKKYDNMLIMNPLVSDPSGGNGHGQDSEAILANHCVAPDPACPDSETSISMDPLNNPPSYGPSTTGAGQYMYYDPVAGENKFHVISEGQDWKFKIGYKKHCRTIDKDTKEEKWVTTEEDMEITFPKAQPNGTYPITGNNPYGRYPDPVEGEAGRRTTGSGHYITYLSEKVCFVEECEDCKIEIKTDTYPSGWANEGTNNMNPGGIDRCQTLSQCMAWGADGKHAGYDDWWEEYSDANNGNGYHGNGDLQDNLLTNLAGGQVPTPVGAAGSRPEGHFGNCFRPLPNPGAVIDDGAGHHIGLNPNGGFNNMDVVMEITKHKPQEEPCGDDDPDDHDINYHPMIPWQENVWPLPIPGPGLVVPAGGLPEGTVVFIVEGGDPDHTSHPDDCGTIEYWVTEAAITAGTTIPHPDNWTDDEFEGLKELCLHDGSHTDLDCNKIRRCLHPNECPPDCLYCLGDCMRIPGLPGEWTLIDLQKCTEAPVQPRAEDWEEERKKEKQEILEVADNLVGAGELAVPNAEGWEWIIDEDGKWDLLFNDARVLGKTVYWWDTRLSGVGWVADWNKGTIQGLGFDKPITADANRDEGPTNLLVKVDGGEISKSLQLWDYENKETLGWSMSRQWSLEGLPGSLPEAIGPTVRPKTMEEAGNWFLDHVTNKYGDKIYDYHFPPGTDEEIVQHWMDLDEAEAMPGGHWPRTAADSPYNKLSDGQKLKAVKKVFKVMRTQIMDGVPIEVISNSLFTLWTTDPWFTEALLAYAHDWLKTAAGESDEILSAKLWGLLAKIWIGVSGAEYTFPGFAVGGVGGEYPFTMGFPSMVVDSAADVRTLLSAFADIVKVLELGADSFKKLWLNRRRGSLDNDLGALGITGPTGVEFPDTESGLPACGVAEVVDHMKDNISKKGGITIGDIHGTQAISRFMADNIASMGIDVLFVEFIQSPTHGESFPAGVGMSGFPHDGQTVMDAYLNYSGDPWDTTEHHKLREHMHGWIQGNECAIDSQTPLEEGEVGYPGEAYMEKGLKFQGFNFTNHYDEYINVFAACKAAGIAVVGIDCPRDKETGLFAGGGTFRGAPIDPETGDPYAANTGYFDTENYTNHPEFDDSFGWEPDVDVPLADGGVTHISDTYMTSNQHWANVMNKYIFDNPKPDGSDPKFIVWGGGAHTTGYEPVLESDGTLLENPHASSVWNEYGGVNKLIYEAGYAGQAGIKKDIKVYDFLRSYCRRGGMFGNEKYYAGIAEEIGWKRDGSTVNTALGGVGKIGESVWMIDTELGRYEKTPCICLYESHALPKSTKFHGEVVAGEFADMSRFSDYMLMINASNGPELGLGNDHDHQVGADCTELDELPKPPSAPNWGVS